MRLVVDTNVLVSALLKPSSVPALALAALWAKASVLYDARVVAEYTAVLARPKFRGIPRADVEALLAAVRAHGVDLGPVPPWAGALTDDDDRLFIEVALAGRADAIVTGNLRDYPGELGFEVWPPATLLARLD